MINVRQMICARWVRTIAGAGVLLTVIVTGPDASALDASVDKCAAARARDVDLSGYLPVTKPKPVPDVAFFDAQGNERSISTYRGKGVVLNFWATWCPPCVKEMPALGRMRHELSDHGIEVIAVNEDKTLPEDVSGFLDRLGVKNLDVLIDRKNALMKTAKVVSLPTTLIIDAKGHEVAAVLNDGDWDTPEIVAFIKNCIGPEAAAN